MSYFNILRQKSKDVFPNFWQQQAHFLRDGFLMGFIVEFSLLYFNGYDSMTRKSCVRLLDQARLVDYKIKERKKLDEIRQLKIKQLEQLKQIVKQD